MLSSTTLDGDETTTRLTFSSSSSTSLRSPSSSPASHFRPTTTMEDVWKDINLSSLTYVDHSTSADDLRRRLPNPAFIFQDFLAASPARNPPNSPAIFGAPLPSPTRTLLSLNPGVGFDLFESTPPSSRVQPGSTIPAGGFNPFEGLGSPAAALGKKRVDENIDGVNSGDRRHKRMIKNRESAARSRARKQAYTNELEREVDLLLAENARLKKQQEELTSAAALPKKHTLQRTSTAPF